MRFAETLVLGFAGSAPAVDLVGSANLYAAAAQGDRTAWVQLPLALLILLSPVVCLALFVLSLMHRFPGRSRRRLAVAVLPIPPVALLLYLAYESGISPFTNIRVDLLLIYPALGAAFLFWPALLLRYLFSRRGSRAAGR